MLTSRSSFDLPCVMIDEGVLGAFAVAYALPLDGVNLVEIGRK